MSRCVRAGVSVTSPGVPYKERGDGSAQLLDARRRRLGDTLRYSSISRMSVSTERNLVVNLAASAPSITRWS